MLRDKTKKILGSRCQLCAARPLMVVGLGCTSFMRRSIKSLRKRKKFEKGDKLQYKNGTRTESLQALSKEHSIPVLVWHCCFASAPGGEHDN